MGAVVVEAVRTAIGRRNGALSGCHPVDLSAIVLRDVAARSGISPELIDDVIWGCVGQVGEQAHDIARGAVLAAQWPESVPGVTVDRQCGSSQQSLNFAVAGVVAATTTRWSQAASSRCRAYPLDQRSKCAATRSARASQPDTPTDSTRVWVLR